MKLFPLLSILACLFYLDSGFRVLSRDRGARLNRLVFALDLDLALWAFAAAFIYAAPDPAGSRAWNLLFAPTWHLFFGFALHFCILAAGRRGPRGFAGHLLLYGPGLFLTVFTNLYRIEGFLFRGGYWMPVYKQDFSNYLFIAYYASFLGAGMLLLLKARARAASLVARRRLEIMLGTIAVSTVFGFLSDSLAPALGLDFPQLGILWIAIWAAGLRVAMVRYGFFSPFPRAAAKEIVDAIEESFFYLDDVGQVRWANRSGARAAGVADEAALRGKSFVEALGIGGGAREAVLAALASESPTTVELAGFGAGGGAAELTARSFRLAEAPLAGSIVTVRDQSELEKRLVAESRLADAGRIFDAFTENSLDGIILTDPEGRVARWSLAMEEITGVPASEAVGRPVWEIQANLAASGDRDELAAALQASIAGALAGESREWTRRAAEYRIHTRAGEERCLQASTFAVPVSGGRKLMAAVIRDATQQKRAEAEALEELRRLDNAQKMEAVGTLAAGLAHDFNNILTGVLGTVSLLKLNVEDGTYREPRELLEGLGLVETSSVRAVDIARQLLDLTRRHPSELKPVSVAAALARAVELTRNSLDPAVAVEAPAAPPEAVVLAEGSELERILINLLLNAGEAMTTMRPPGEPWGGAVRIRVERRPGGRNGPESYWMLSIRDEGVGIGSDVTARIFDPFYTTKDSGKSTGLGLSIVYNIVKRRGGLVEVDSRPGAGAEFRILLPAHEATREPGRGSS
ncbi:MAG: PAS domain S-box protein [Spirochaetaceae bacterium]|nr:PAS domain S-box protein [Spirochaetaceae bacterium]